MCGIVGIAGFMPVNQSIYDALSVLQHRGQDAAGIITIDAHNCFRLRKANGLVNDVFEARHMQRLQGNMGIGHVRYPTAGSSSASEAQPFYVNSPYGITLAHNGNLTNFKYLHAQLVSEGAIFQSTSDSEAILHLIARSRKTKIVDRFIDALSRIEGGYALVAQTRFKMIGARDPLGIRPLVLGKVGEAWVLASETCALDTIGATFVRDVEHGEVVVIDEEGLTSIKPFAARAARPCLFEYVYFARPDSVVNGLSVYDVRKEMGRRLAREHKVEADIVVPVPDSGVPAALGYAQESGLPYEMGIIRSHYLGRTFIQPSQGARQKGVRMKHSPNRAALEGKRVVLIDDSIVRGTTSLKLVRAVRAAGAKEVHLRSASPQILYPDFYGIDMPERSQLMAATHSMEEMRAVLEVDSLGFLSIDGLYDALGAGPRNATSPQYTDHYFTGYYPTRLLDREIEEGGRDPRGKQLSLLVTA